MSDGVWGDMEADALGEETVESAPRDILPNEENRELGSILS